MSTYLPQDVRDGLDAARIARLRKGNRLRVVVGGDSWPLLRLWRTGFSTPPPLVSAQHSKLTIRL